MIQLLTGKNQKKIAWLLLIVFYGDMLAAYASAKYAGGNRYAGETRNQAWLYAIGPIENGYTKAMTKPVATPVIAAKKNEELQAPLELKMAWPVVEKKNELPANWEKPDIGGPGQPEMSSFKSAGADNMVNLFTGDFSYNIPLLDVGGYPVNIFYNAGGSMDQEASWVGYGWNINPGTINRNMRGLPDDYNGQDMITKTQSIKPDLTVGVTGSTGGEVLGVPNLGVNLNAGIFYNNRRGVGLEAGAGFDYSPMKMVSGRNAEEKTFKDTVKNFSISGGINLNSQNGMSLNGGFALYDYNKQKAKNTGISTSLDFNSRQGITDISISGETTRYKWESTKAGSHELAATGSGSLPTVGISFARSSFTPSIRMPLTRFNQFYSVKLGKEKKILFKNGTIGAFVNESRIAQADQVQTKPAYGYMYYEKANTDKNAMLDFNRLQDGVYTYKTPVISVPVYTYDVFSISGEGTGGTFRGYRGNMGYMRDNYTKTKSGSLTVSADLGVGDIVHTGIMLGGVYSPTEVGEWKKNNTLRETAAFKDKNELFEPVYFKNPGEQAIIDQDYYNKVGGDQLIRPYLINTNHASPMLAGGFQVFDKNLNVERTIPVDADTYRKQRDKRTQLITSFTAEEADLIGLDKFIYSYKENVFEPGSCANPAVRTPVKRYNPNDPAFYRKANHLSEIDVLEADGRKYVYGIPVYQVKQKEVTFSTENTPAAGSQLIVYTPGEENSVENKKGRDGLYQSEDINGYAHSFLLTGILSPDYMDVTGDGITDDDKGTAIRFNYSRVNKRGFDGIFNYWNVYKWRMPVYANTANYNEGLKADNRDDKGLYTYGEKELWYMHSIESKNMVATFYVSDRRDGNPVTGDNGGLDNRVTRTMQKKLDKINLYTKADFLKFGASAKPVKTVHFEYSYSTCPNFALNDGLPVDKNGAAVSQGSPANVNTNKGKLTLTAVWFSYNGNNNQVKNKYLFKYAASNPAYNSAENDRWGNYKPHADNPDGASNNDYPYCNQDITKSNTYSTAWNLEKVLLPGGAVMEVQYEADDYAFVQDRRAAQMTQMAGFGSSATSTPSNKLYTLDLAKLAFPATMDHRFVFFDLPQPVQTKAEIGEKYLKDFTQLLLKLWVKMPKGNIGQDPAWQPVVIYGQIKDFGFAQNGNGTDNHSRFYIELEKTKRNGSPIMETVMQFLKEQLPQRAYPGYEVKEGSTLLQYVRSVFGMIAALWQGVMGFERDLKLFGKGNETLLNRSFARLDNPVYKKTGGGHRVKQIRINDNWDRMTGQYQSFYGQQYDYTTKEMINGQPVIISSGVASYEPGIGNEENPFREVLAYDVKQFLGPTDHNNIELPIAETFFPSPMVGYSRVSVKSIHNKDNKNIKSAVGLQQTEFYTTRDYPVLTDFTSFDEFSRDHHKPGVIQRVFKFDKKDFLTLTQGVRVVLNDMNGKLKSQSSYAENDLENPVNYTATYYRKTKVGENKYELDNLLPVISGPDGKITNKLVGKDVEVMNDFREHFSYTYAANIPLNADIFKLGTLPVLIPTIFRLAFRDKSLYRSATTLKIVNEYGIIDSVVNIDKGSVVGTKNLVYDAETGGVLVSRTYNEFKKPVYQFNYPAWWVYPGMGPAYKNIDLAYKNVLFRNGRIEESPQVNMDNFESGDEIYVVDYANNGVTQSPACVILGNPPTLPRSAEYRIWAVDIGKDTRNTTKEFIFIDRYGNPYNAANATIRIIRSGKRNITGASVGSIVSLSSPVRTINNEDQVIIDNNTDVINAGAAEFKEKWRVNDMFYAKTEFTDVIRKAPVHLLNATPVASASMTFYYLRGGTTSSGEYSLYYNKDFALGYRYLEKAGGKSSTRMEGRAKSWLQFDLSAVTPQKTILSAKLSMYSHKEFESYGNHFIHPTGYGYQPGSHEVNNPHTGPNNFLIKRILGVWPGNNYNNLKSYLNSSTIGDAATQIVGGATSVYNLPVNDLSYCSNCSPSGNDNRFEVKGMVQAMLADRDNPAKQYATALQLELMDPEGKGYRRICFNSGMLNSQLRKPTLSIKYYDCAEAYGLPGNSATPPNGQEVVDCINREWVTSCLSVFSKKQMNPYIEGVLGNWRAFRSYVYYGERRESDPAVATDIRKDGIIKNYESYWDFDNANIQLVKTNSAKWVWNSEITQFNRKGAELEDHDPLGRYNAGIYGYQESLPVAVINNSRLRLSAFDGFEDYYYKDDPCEPYCKPSKRHFATGVSTAMLDEAQSHTGKYSAKVNAGAAFTMDVKVSADDAEANPDIRIKLDKTAVQEVVSVTPNGIGLKGYYYNSSDFQGSPINTREDASINLSFKAKNNNGCVNGYPALPPSVNCGNMSVQWKGKIQVVTPGFYEFMGANSDDQTYVHINGTLVATDIWGGTHTRTAVYLTAGTLHTIQVDFRQFQGYGSIQLQWKKPGQTNFVPIDPRNLYPEGKEYLADNTTVTQTVYCVKPDDIQAINHHLVDSFNLVNGQKMVISAWVKKGSQDCKCTGYSNVSIKVKNAAGGEVAVLQPKERIIEGWQQFETVFTVPAGEKIQLEFNGPADGILYFDDLRLHPFNANMKSFVYDPVTLRLAAELDENNYASLYEYDDDGTLIRVKKETRQGIKTITETRSGIQKNITGF